MSTRLITVFWRDIPAQIIIRKGRRTAAKIQLDARFQEAIDRAAMRAGKGSSDQYLADWRRESELCEGDPQATAEAAVREFDAQFPDDYLEKVIKNGGLLPDEHS